MADQRILPNELLEEVAERFYVTDGWRDFAVNRPMIPGEITPGQLAVQTFGRDSIMSVSQALIAIATTK